MYSYKDSLKKWVIEYFVPNPNAWNSTQVLQQTFEGLHLHLAIAGTTTNMFSRYLREITGMKSIKGGDLGQHKGFAVGLVKTLAELKRRRQSNRIDGS